MHERAAVRSGRTLHKGTEPCDVGSIEAQMLAKKLMVSRMSMWTKMAEMP